MQAFVKCTLFFLFLGSLTSFSSPPKLLVAIIDTGVDMTHPELKNNLDSSLAWNFAMNNSDVSDTNGHGTHIAGVVLKSFLNFQHKNQSEHIKLLPIKYYSKQLSARENLNHLILAIEYAVSQGARIINISAGGPYKSNKELQALKKAKKQGVIVVTSSGNYRTGVRGQNFYPAAYGLSNIISVGALDKMGQPLYEHASSWTDDFAPGQNVFSTLPGGNYGYKTGSSQAAAYMTGFIAHQMIKNHQTFVDSKEQLLSMYRNGILSKTDQFFLSKSYCYYF